jgi:hypothetical protein
LRHVTGTNYPQFPIFASDDTTNTVTATASVVASTWYFVYASLDFVNNLLKLSVNDGAVDSASKTKTIADGTGPFQIGAQNSGSNWEGCIDQVGFWKRVLDPGEVTRLYNNGNGMSYADMLLFTGAVPSRMSLRLGLGL